MTNSMRISFASVLVVALALVVGLTSINLASAGHNGAVVSWEGGACEETVFSATIADPEGTHKVSNMYLVVDTEDGDEQFANIPTDGTSVEISVGPFAQDTTVSWHVFGGAERSYDQPLWNGFGDPDFSSDINDYANEVGTFNWVISGTDDPNPFVTWNEVEVPGCSPEVKDDCKNGGWEAYGFRNQGLCIQYVNTGIDSR